MISASMRCFKRCGFAAMYSGRFAAKRGAAFAAILKDIFIENPLFFENSSENPQKAKIALTSPTPCAKISPTKVGKAHAKEKSNIG